MQKNIVIFCFIFVCIFSGCHILQPTNNCDVERMKVQQLEQENVEIKSKNELLQKDNQELANAGKRTLDRLSTMQQRYAEMSEENRGLSAQNQELLEKLYQERLQKNEKWREENLQAKKVFDSYLPEWEVENEKARQLFNDQLTPKETNIKKPTVTERTKNDAPIPTPADGKNIIQTLEKKRLELINRKTWTIQDERKFTNITENLLQKNIPAKEQAEYQQQAIELDLELSNRLDF